MFLPGTLWRGFDGIAGLSALIFSARSEALGHSEIAHAKQDLSIAEAQLRDYEARLGKPFQHDANLTELTALRDQLKAGLSATAHQPESGEP
jgi:hypothetical protein